MMFGPSISKMPFCYVNLEEVFTKQKDKVELLRQPAELFSLTVKLTVTFSGVQ